jgi:TonB family protein
LAWTTLSHYHSEASRAPAAAVQQPATEITPKPHTQAPQAPSTAGSQPSVAEEDQQSAKDVPSRVPVRSKAAPAAVDDGANLTAKPSAAVTQGKVVQQVLPGVLESARESIHGTVRVAVKVDVDPSGSVADAKFENPGPSKYFARQALQAARLWKFKPPQIAGQSVPTSWILRFAFTRSGITAIPTQEIR